MSGLRRMLLAGLGLVAICCRQPALVHDGRPEGVIVASASAKGDEALAATELRDHLVKISGATLPIQVAPPKDGPAVRIGVFGQDPVRDWPGPRPEPVRRGGQRRSPDPS